MDKGKSRTKGGPVSVKFISLAETPENEVLEGPEPKEEDGEKPKGNANLAIL